MATTYTLIASSAPTSDATSVVFSSIPQTYTDLVVRWSVRQTGGGTFGDANIYINSEGGSNYSWTRVRGDGSTGVISGNTSTASNWSMNNATNNGGSTTNVFSTNECYIPNYTSTTVNKSAYVVHYVERLAAVTYITAAALYRSATAAVTSVGFGSGFATGTTFYLYGIKNS